MQLICTICLEEPKTSTDWSAVVCGHFFHTECVEEALKSCPKCPECPRLALPKYLIKMFPVLASESESDGAVEAAKLRKETLALKNSVKAAAYELRRAEEAHPEAAREIERLRIRDMCPLCETKEDPYPADPNKPRVSDEEEDRKRREMRDEDELMVALLWNEPSDSVEDPLKDLRDFGP